MHKSERNPHFQKGGGAAQTSLFAGDIKSPARVWAVDAETLVIPMLNSGDHFPLSQNQSVLEGRVPPNMGIFSLKGPIKRPNFFPAPLAPEFWSIRGGKTTPLV